MFTQKQKVHQSYTLLTETEKQNRIAELKKISVGSLTIEQQNELRLLERKLKNAAHSRNFRNTKRKKVEKLKYRHVFLQNEEEQLQAQLHTLKIENAQLRERVRLLRSQLETEVDAILGINFEGTSAEAQTPLQMQTFFSQQDDRNNSAEVGVTAIPVMSSYK